MAAETFRIEIITDVKDKTGEGLGSASNKFTAFDKTIEKTKKKLDDFSRSKFSLVIDAVDKASSVAERIGTTVKGLASKAWRISMSVLDKATAPIQGIINLLKNPLLQLGAVVGITVSLADTINTFKEFEATMSKVQAVGEMTSDQIAVITQKAKEMGETTKFTATEAGEAFTYMAQAGWSTQEMLNGIEGVLALSAADGLDLASTASIVTDTLFAFGLQASDTAHFADVLAKAAAATNVNVAQMGETFTYVAPVAGAMGYSVEDMSTAIGLMANASVKGSMAGTALKTAISNMVTPTDEQAALMKELGVSMTDSAGNANGFMTVMSDLRKGFSKLSETEKTATASTLFGSYAMSGMLAIVNASEDSFNGLSESIANCEGTAQQMSEVMLDNLAGSFTLLQSAADGVKITLGQRLSPYLRQFATWLTGKMPDIQKAVGEVMDFVDEKVAWLKETINEFTSGEDWENADIWGKIKIAWDKIVAEPFSQWWNSTGKAWFAEKAASIGQGIGSGLTTGLLAMLGVDISDTLGEGKMVGASFLQGFKDGFDTEAITNAMKEWAENNKEIVAALGVILGGKLISGVYKGVKEAKSLVTDIKNIFSKGSSNTTASGGASAYTTTTMTVTAQVVNVYGSVVNNMDNGGGNYGDFFEKYVGTKLLTTGGKEIIKTFLPSGTGTGGNIIKGLLTGGGSTATAAGGNVVATQLTNGVTLAGTGGIIKTALATLGTNLGGSAATMGGAAAIGGSTIAGIIGGVLGIGSAVIDLFQGIGKSKEGDSKGAKDEYVTSGTKAGMVGAGAGIGAAIGSIIPGAGTAIGALVGAGVGGIGALFGGDAAGKAISDGSDEGGWLDSAWKGTKSFFTDTLGNFFTQTVPKAWNSLWGSVGNFFTNTIPAWWGNLTTSVSNFFTETIPEKWGEFWDGVGNFFTETIPYALGYATSKVQIFFTETIPEFFGDLWEGISTFFGSTIPTWASTTWNEKIVPFFTESIPEFFGNLWGSISTFFTSTLLTWASTMWNEKIVPFFIESIPEFFGGLWEAISGFFTTTLPTWASNTWNNSIVPFFTETIPGFFGSIWDTVTNFFTEAIPNLASNIWNSISGWFSSIGDWFGNVWGKVKSFFGAGYDAGMEGHADGGIFSKPHMAYVAEAGPEAIIPLSPSKRTRAREIYDQVTSVMTSTTSGANAEAITPHATGGILTRPHLGLVAEAGAESIIPLSPSKRTRGIDLWRETGQLLGVRAYADGGIVGETEEPETDGNMPVTFTTGGNGVIVKVEVSASPEFKIEGGAEADEAEILAILKAYIRTMTDDIGDELAERLTHIFKNMPVTA